MTDSTQQLLEKARAAAEAARQMAEQAQHYSDEIAQTAAAAASHGLAGGAIDPLVFRLAIFALAVFVGYYVVWSVTPALHTPLMSVTNAISSVIVVGALLSVGVEQSSVSDTGAGWARWFGFIALVLACVNIFGGFLVTERMLAMYKKKG
jgi:proton-translocating NAD(P)+ transhydrogenase subunit alpha